MTSLVKKIPKGNIRTEQEIRRTLQSQKKNRKGKRNILKKELEAQEIHKQRIRAGPGTSVWQSLEGQFALPGRREEAEWDLMAKRSKEMMGEEEHFRLSPPLLDEQHFVPINPMVEKKELGLGSRSFGKLTPEPAGLSRSPILELITREDLLKKRSPPTSPKNYPGKEGTGEKAAADAKTQHLKIERTKSKYYGGKKRRKTRKRKRRRKRKTRRKKKRKKRKRKTRKKRTKRR